MIDDSDSRERRRARGNLIKMALIYTPIAVLCLIVAGIAISKIIEGEHGFWFTLVLFGSVGLLTGSLAVHYIRDLTASPVEIQGELVRKWTKGNLFFFFMPAFYITVDSKTFEGRVEQVVDNGAFIRLHSGELGFCSRKHLDIETKGRTSQEMVHPGQEVSYKITGVDRHGTYKVSCRKAEERAVVGKIFSISRAEYAMLLDLDLVKVTYYPHSATVQRLDRYDESEKGFIPAATGATT